MNLKYPTYLLFIFCLQFAISQTDSSTCKCNLLEQSDENDTKVANIASEIEESFYNESTEGFIKYFDPKSFSNSIIKRENNDPLDDYTRGFMDGIKDTSDNLALKLVNEIKNGAYYNAISYHYNVVEQAYYFTFRMYSDELGVNYHDYKVCSDGTNVKVNDIYIYMIGENLSETLGRIYLLSKPNNKKRLKALLGLNSAPLLESFLKAKRQADLGNYEKAYEYLTELKGEPAKEKFILLLKGTYASMFDYNLYEEVLKEFAELHPNDPTLYLKQIDYYILQGNYKKAIYNLDELIFETEDDFINLLKGNVYILSEDFVNAEKSYLYMTVNYPDLFEGYIGYMVSLNYQDKFEEAIAVIEKLIEKDYDTESLIEFIEEKEPDGSNALAPLVNSKVYKKWKRKL